MTIDRPVVVNPEAIGDPDQTPVVLLPPAATDATPPTASTSPPRSDADAESASEDVPAPPGPSVAFLATSNETADPVGPSGDVPSLLARAQERLGCERYQDEPLLSNCWQHIPGQPKIADLTWPCSEATRLAALLAEVAASAWDEGYRLDWTGGVRHTNPYRTGADQ